MIQLGVQYYRAPFPNEKYWEDDFKRIVDSGLNTVQLWVVWAWVEPKPGEFIFDDYDRLIELADRTGLKVTLSTIAAVQPYWIHREETGSEMLTNMGEKVISSNRGECHFGLTPGGCTDHPGVWARMSRFLAEVATRYKDAPNLNGWDVWNELRWNVQADGLACYCTHTRHAFRAWLDEKYDGLEGVNSAWVRRYRSWHDVRPGKCPGRPYTEMMAFEHFITWRSCQHARARYDVVKGIDPDHPVTVHGGQPSVLHGDSYPGATALHRGNDWSFADHLDGIGCSSFPLWFGIDNADYVSRLDFLISAARDKRIWLSEVQGGRASTGFKVHKPVPAAPQQRWIWTGIAGGAEAVLFWCWRDEVFGSESAGFGMSGNDGLADERLAAMACTGRLIAEHNDLLEGYRPLPAEAGVFFSPQSYYYHWAQDGNGHTAVRAVQGYCRALIRNNIPLRIVEEEHLEALAGLRVLFLPRVMVIDEPAAEALGAFVRGGGTLVCESECGAFGSNGLYRYPEDRFLTALTGVRELGRRTLDATHLRTVIGEDAFAVPAGQWLTPYAADQGTVLARHADGPLVLEVPVEKGRVILCGTYMGEAYYDGSLTDGSDYAPFCADFERFIRRLTTTAGVVPPVEVVEPDSGSEHHILVRAGMSGSVPLAFVISDENTPSRLRFRDGLFDGKAVDLISGAEVEMRAVEVGVECDVPASEWGVTLLRG